MFLYDAILRFEDTYQNFSPAIELEEPPRLLVNANRLATVSRLVDSNVKTLTVCSNKFTYLLESKSSQQLVVTFIMGLP
jgi:hypothetical protein